MSTENLTATLIKKMEAEQDRYRAWLVDQPPTEILKYTHEDVCCKGEFQIPNTT